MKGSQEANGHENKANRATIASITMLVLSLSVMIGAFIYNDQQSQLLLTHKTNAGELRVLSQQIAKNASEAASGKEEGFPSFERGDMDV